MDNTNYYDFMTVRDLKDILRILPDDMPIVIPVVDEDDVNCLRGFRKVRTAGVLHCESEEDKDVFSLNGATEDNDIVTQVYMSSAIKNIDVAQILYDGDGTFVLTKEGPLMTSTEFADYMTNIKKTSHCKESRHVWMDEVMCKLLRQLGYGEGIDIFENTDKWYA